MRARQIVIPKNDKVLKSREHCVSACGRSLCVYVCVHVTAPVIVGEAWPPVGRPEERLEGAGQVHKQVTHQEEPAGTRAELNLKHAHTHVHTQS